MTKRICIVTGAHPGRNPRVVKEAAELARHGYAVTVLAPALTDDLCRADASLLDGAQWRVVRTTRLSRNRRGPHLEARLRTRLAREAVAHLGIQAPAALGYGVRETLRVARSLAADLYIAHQEVGAWVGTMLLRDKRRVAADFEDWYSEDLLPPARRHRPMSLLRHCERVLLTEGAYSTTTSAAMAARLNAEYGGQPPRVIYNAFSWADRRTIERSSSDRRGGQRPSLYWFSQTIGPGRGLEGLMDALATVSVPVDVHLRGNHRAQDLGWLETEKATRAGHRIHLHDVVPPSEVLGRIAEHDIGLALEDGHPLNKDLTVSNKILHYLLAGVPVIATCTSGQREVAQAAPGAVDLCGTGSHAELAAAIMRQVASAERLEEGRRAALAAAKSRFCWEQQAPVLLECVARALAAPDREPRGRRQ